MTPFVSRLLLLVAAMTCIGGLLGNALAQTTRPACDVTNDSGDCVSDAATGDVEPSDAGTAAVVAPDGAPDPSVLRRERYQQLTTLLTNLEPVSRGELPPDGAITDLFSFDLNDARAVELERHDLRKRIERLTEELRGLDATERIATSGKQDPTGDGGVELVDASEDAKAPAAEQDADTVAHDKAAHAARVGADGETAGIDADVPDTTAGRGVPGPTDDASHEPDARALLELELRVARARLAFLELPSEQRETLLVKSAERRRLAAEQKRANSDLEEALAEQQRAEGARQRALAEAERARDELHRAIANEQARMEGISSSQAVYQRELAQRRQSLVARAAELQTRWRQLSDRLSQVEPNSPQADALYNDVAAELDTVLQVAREDLAHYTSMPAPPSYSPDSGFEAIEPTVPQATREQLRRRATNLRDTATQLSSQARTLAWEALSASMERLQTVNAARLGLLPNVTRAKHEAVLSLGTEGRAHLRRELNRMRLEATWYRARTEYRISSLSTLRKDPLWVGQLTWLLLVLAGTAAATVWVARRGPGWLTALRVGIAKTIARPAYARPLTLLVDSLDALWGPFVLLSSVLVARRLLGTDTYGVELALLLRLLTWYAVYRLFISAFHRLLFNVIHRRDSIVGLASTTRSERLARSVRMVARYVFSVALALVLAEEILGKGFLYAVVARFAWLGAFPIFALLVRWWRSDIADAYLALFPSGRLVSAVTSTRERWYGFFVAAAAFLVVLARSCGNGVHHFVLRFEQTRKALAFIFRRRLERKTSEADDEDLGLSLPEDLLQWFVPSPVATEAYALADVPGYKEFDARLTTWRTHSKAAPVIVVGHRGMGKSSWLNLAKARLNQEQLVTINVAERVLTENAVVSLLADALGMYSNPADTAVANQPPPTRQDVIDTILATDRCAIAIDDVHHFVLRGVDVADGWKTLVAIVQATRDHCLWILTMDACAYQYLAWSRRAVEVFPHVVELTPWSEERVTRMIDMRTQASGYDMHYEDLIVDKLDGIEAEAQLVRTRGEYMRLIWDYADGCPTVVLHCWTASLRYDGDKRVRVKLFRRPDALALETLSDVQRFVLAATVWHTTITVEEASRSLNYDTASCTNAIELLHDRGVIEQHQGRYRVTIEWLCPVMRFLHYKYLVHE